MKINLNTANELIRRYRQARANLERVEAIERKLAQQALLEGDYRNEDTGARITDYQAAYMMSEADFDHFLRARYELECASWIADQDGYEYSATREPAEALKRAENDMIAYMLETMPDVYARERETLNRGVAHDYAIRQRFVALTLTLNVPANRKAV